MPLLFYGRLERGKRRLFTADLGRIETSVFDKWRIKHLAPHSGLVGIANFWHFPARKHTAISWHDNRRDIRQAVGIKSNEVPEPYEQTIFIPGLTSSMVALEIARTEFPRWLVPSPIIFKFNNPDEALLYD